ncbi:MULTISPECIES: hypothetical protein [unclassified Halomonas]|uniref:hypothetical protein n=1 Tax=unclassified Halomonas TaxID=2609666 RepID=UPI00099079D8|nr:MULTISPECIES: hypothetical protein [unclassified Halomonas]AQU83994.1 hypothetical protein B2G49_16260 [Halomonas sp. 'Soap Lake \
MSKHTSGALIAAMIAAGSMVAGCGDGAESAGSTSGQTTDSSAETQSQQGSAAPDDEMQAWLNDLSQGESVLNISGAVSSTGEYTTADAPRYGGVSVDVFRPGSGGGSARAGSNADGPYALTIYTDATHEDEPDNVVRAWISLVLPEGATAGERYAISSFSAANEHQVQAHLRGDGHAWTFARQIEGELYLVELGDSVTAAWRFDAADGNREDAAQVAVEGAVNNLAFTVQPEARYELTVNGETDTHLGRITINTSNSGAILSIGNRISLMLPSGISAGEYPLSDRSEEGVLRVMLPRYEVDSVDGTLTLAQRNGVFDADIRFEAGGEDSVSLDGRLEGLALNE